MKIFSFLCSYAFIHIIAGVRQIWKQFLAFCLTLYEAIKSKSSTFPAFFFILTPLVGNSGVWQTATRCNGNAKAALSTDRIESFRWWTDRLMKCPNACSLGPQANKSESRKAPMNYWRNRPGIYDTHCDIGDDNPIGGAQPKPKPKPTSTDDKRNK